MSENITNQNAMNGTTQGLGNNTTIPSNMPETYTNSLYSPGFFRNFIGKLVKAEFLLGSAGMQDRIGILVDVGASYIVLRSVQDNNLLYCDIFSIKFLTISQQPFVYNPPQAFGMQTRFCSKYYFITKKTTKNNSIFSSFCFL
mgnify:CR=1 FL=1